MNLILDGLVAFESAQRAGYGDASSRSRSKFCCLSGEEQTKVAKAGRSMACIDIVETVIAPELGDHSVRQCMLILCCTLSERFG
jgi:hypothetical protein